MVPVRFLSYEDMGQIHIEALHILEKTGMKVDHPKALEYLRQTGCSVDMDRRTVRFPEDTVEQAVATMKKNFADPERWPKRTSVRYSEVRFCAEAFRVHQDFSVSTGGFCRFIWDLERQRRPACLEDVRAAIRLADRLDQITYAGLPCSAQDLSAEVRPVVMAAELG